VAWRLPDDRRRHLAQPQGGGATVKTPHVFLMCPPEYYDVAYIINPWMQGNVRQIDNALAKKQWRALYDILTDHANVRLVSPQPGSPDMVFTANAGLVKGRRFLASRFRYPERQQEEPYFAEWFVDRGYDVSRTPREIPFEGAGDALADRGANRLWFAHGLRSVPAASEVIARLMGGEVVSLKLVDRRFYHLDTCFCPLEGGHLLYFPQAFDPASRAAIEKRVPESLRIAVSAEDTLDFACNAVAVGRTVVLHRASTALVDALGRRGFAVVQTPLSEFMKAGGSAKCLTLRLDEP